MRVNTTIQVEGPTCRQFGRQVNEPDVEENKRMIRMDSQLLGSHRGTYEAIFGHPVARNLQWRDVRSLLSSVATVAEEPNGNLKYSRNGQTLTVHPPRRKDFSDVDELMRIRQFLEHSGAGSQEGVAQGVHLLVVIDHREARIFSTELHGSVPQRISPYDPHGAARYLHYVEDDSNGQRKPEPKAFYEAVAKTLRGAEKIVVFGSGTGASSAMDRLMAELRQHHPDISRRVFRSLVVDQPHMSDDQLLARAREVYCGRSASGGA